MSIFRSATLLISIILLTANARAQQGGWTLQKCIQFAMENNIQIKQNELNAEIAYESKRQSVANLLPSLNAGASHSYNWGQRIDPFTNQFATDRVRSNNFWLSSSVTLFSGLQLNNSVKQSQLDWMANKHTTDKMRNDISLNIANAFVQIIFAEELLKVAENQKTITAAQLERTRKMVEAGTMPQSNLYDMQAQLASDELAIVNAQNNLDLANLTLAQILNLPSVQDFSIITPDVETPSQTLLEAKPQDIFNTAVNRLPEVKSAETQLQSSEKGVDIARGTAYPSLTLNGSLGTGYSGLSQRVTSVSISGTQEIGVTANNETVYAPVFDTETEVIPFTDQLDRNLNETVGLTLNIPIFNGWQSRTSISQAKLARENAELSLEQVKDNLRQTIQQAYADALAALKQFRATEKTVEAMRESFTYAEKRYNVGVLNVTDYNDSKNRLAKAESDLLRAKYDYIFKTKVLDFYQGKPLKFE